MHDPAQISAWLRRIAPNVLCARCQSAVERIDLQRNPILKSWLFEAHCHGKRRILQVPFDVLPIGELRSIMLFEPAKKRVRRIPELVPDLDGRKPSAISSSPEETPAPARHRSRTARNPGGARAS